MIQMVPTPVMLVIPVGIPRNMSRPCLSVATDVTLPPFTAMYYIVRGASPEPDNAKCVAR